MLRIKYIRSAKNSRIEYKQEQDRSFSSYGKSSDKDSLLQGILNGMRARDGARSEDGFRASDFGGEDSFQLFTLQKNRYSLAIYMNLMLAADRAA
jgi:hypothetical protein